MVAPSPHAPGLLSLALALGGCAGGWQHVVAESVGPVALPKALEMKLRGWWGNVHFAEAIHLLTEDRNANGFLLANDFQSRAENVLSRVVDHHASGARCASLPVKMSSHSWRYDERELSECLQLGVGETCNVSCQLLPSVSTTLACKESTFGWALVGEPPLGRCRWALDTAVVNTSGGFIQGVVMPTPWRWVDGKVSVEHVRTYWGVPYADRPERFAMARPLSGRWRGVRFTDFYDFERNASVRMHCAGAAPLDKGGGVEDCLFLDLFVPRVASHAKPLPVMVFLIPAGFTIGDAYAEGLYELQRLAIKDSIVVVVVSARTAALGHWAHPALTTEYGDGSAGNIGERDQRVALRWVQSNIMAFGGDPTGVTLMGHSSGAFDVTFHLLSPASRDLLTSAILESSTFDCGWYYQSREEAFDFYSTLGDALGCVRDNGDGAQITCLRALPLGAFYNISANQTAIALHRVGEASYFSDAWLFIKSLLSAEWGFDGGFRPTGLGDGDAGILATPLWPILPFGIVVDGSDVGLPASPRKMYEAGESLDVPVYINHERDEGTVFALVLAAVFPWQKSASLTHAAVDAMFEWSFGPNSSFTSEVLRRYPHGSYDNAPFNRLSRAITDSVFKCSARRFAKARKKQGKALTFWAEHTFPGSGVHSKSAWSAAFHRDINYFLGSSHVLPTLQNLGIQSFDSPSTTGPWTDVDQKNHEIMHCHFALMFHCNSPGALPDSDCQKDLISRNITLHACVSLTPEDVYPFDGFNASSGQRKELHPSRHGLITPSNEETELCQFWDQAPPMTLQPNNCRGCASHQVQQAQQAQRAQKQGQEAVVV